MKNTGFDCSDKRKGEEEVAEPHRALPNPAAPGVQLFESTESPACWTGKSSLLLFSFINSFVEKGGGGG